MVYLDYVRGSSNWPIDSGVSTLLKLQTFSLSLCNCSFVSVETIDSRIVSIELASFGLKFSQFGFPN